MNWLTKRRLNNTSVRHETSTGNPYLNARRTWNDHVAGVMSAAYIWQLVGMVSLLISLAAVGGVIYIGSQSKFVPLVFQQDSSGNTISVTKADKVPDAKIDDYRTAVAKFIENIRLVTLDVDLQRKAILQTYTFLSPNDPATNKANDYLNASNEVNPFSRAAHEMVSIDIRSVLQQSKNAWQIDWLETVRHRDGTLKDKPYLMRAIVTIYQHKLANDATTIEALRNPHFIFVRDFNWSKQL